MMIRRCAWHRRHFGHWAFLGVASWRGVGVTFTDGICPACAAIEKDGMLARRASAPRPASRVALRQRQALLAAVLATGLALVAADLMEVPVPSASRTATGPEPATHGVPDAATPPPPPPPPPVASPGVERVRPPRRGLATVTPLRQGPGRGAVIAVRETPQAFRQLAAAAARPPALDAVAWVAPEPPPPAPALPAREIASLDSAFDDFRGRTPVVVAMGPSPLFAAGEPRTESP
jgi:hypothetical protein